MSSCFSIHSNVSEETKQQNSELSEQIKLSNEEKGAMKFEVEDLRKRLELADLMLQQVQWCKHADLQTVQPFFSPHLLKSTFLILLRQCSSQSDPTSATQQAQLLLEEKQQLEMHNHQVSTHESQAAAIHKCSCDPILYTFCCRSCWSPWAICRKRGIVMQNRSRRRVVSGRTKQNSCLHR